jgi:hypothetical protein
MVDWMLNSVLACGQDEFLIDLEDKYGYIGFSQVHGFEKIGGRPS